MANFTFPCPKCGQPIEADHEWHGQNAPCPHCSETIMIPFGVKLSVPSSKKKSLSFINILVAATLLLAIGAGVWFFTSNAKSAPSTPALSTKGSSLNLTMKLVTNENQDVTPFSRVIIFPYEPSWDKEIELFKMGIAASKILKNTYGVTEVQLARNNADAAGALQEFINFPNPLTGAEFRTGTYTFEDFPDGKYVIVAVGDWKNTMVYWLRIFEKKPNQPLTLDFINDDTCRVITK